MILFVSIMAALALATKPHVVELEEEELEMFVLKREVVMANIFKRKDCEKCDNVTKEFKKALILSEENQLPYHFVKIDAVRNPRLGLYYLISGYPSVKLFINGHSIDYEGDYTAAAFLDFIEKRKGPCSTFLSTVQEVERVRDSSGVRCILATDNPDKLTRYMNLGRDEDFILFYHTPFKIAKSAFPALVNESTVIMMRDDKGPFFHWKVHLLKGAYKEFLRMNELEKVNDLNDKIINYISRGKRNGIILYTSNNTSELVQNFIKFANQNQQKTRVFVITNSTTDIISANFTKSVDPPSIQIISYIQDVYHRYPLTSNFNMAGLKGFLDNWEKKNCIRVIKSEDEKGAHRTTDILPRVTARKFEQEVLKSEIPVLVNFCKFPNSTCEKVDKILKDIKEKFPNIKFISVNTPLNEIPEVPVMFYPTLRLFQKNKDWVELLEEINEENVSSFISANIPEIKKEDL